MSFDGQVIQRQGELITQLRVSLEKAVRARNGFEDEVRRLKAAAGYWLRLQELIIDNPTLQSEWVRFVAMLKLACDDEPGFTREIDATTHDYR